MQFAPAIQDGQALFKLSKCTDLLDLTRIEHLIKVEEGIYALFDAKGKLSFVAPDDEGTTSILPLKNKIEAQ